MKHEDWIMILDSSGVPMTPTEKAAGFFASIRYLQGLYHGPVKFKGKDAEGIITGKGSFVWGGASGENFEIEFEGDRRTSFFLPARFESMHVPESFAKLSRLTRHSPTFDAPSSRAAKKKKSLH